MSPASYQTAPPRVAMESGKRDSNPRPQPWQGCALPTELFPQTLLNASRKERDLHLPSWQSSEPDSTRRSTPRCHAALPLDGGEGNRTPDLLNAIQALSQLSYAPLVPNPAVHS